MVYSGDTGVFHMSCASDIMCAVHTAVGFGLQGGGARWEPPVCLHSALSAGQLIELALMLGPLSLPKLSQWLHVEHCSSAINWTEIYKNGSRLQLGFFLMKDIVEHN